MNSYLSKLASEYHENFQPIKPSHRGLLHEQLDIPEGEKIPTKKLEHILATSDDPRLRKRVQFALNARKWKHAKKAEETFKMPMSEAISEHKKLVEVLKSNDRKKELEELEEQGDELKEMLAKKASEKANEKNTGFNTRPLGAYSALAGGVVAHNAYHSGDITGRKTLYHGTAPSSVKKILNEGLKPNARYGVTRFFEEAQHEGRTTLGSDSLVFTTPNKNGARVHSLQGEIMDRQGKEGLVRFLHNPDKEKLVAEDAVMRTFFPKKDDNTLKINAPTWKSDVFHQVPNPEKPHQIANIKNHPFMTESQKKSYIKSVSKQFDEHFVNKGEIGPEHFVKSPHYKPNSASEIVEYATKNKARFMKGVGKAGVAAGLVGLGAKLMTSKSGDNS